MPDPDIQCLASEVVYQNRWMTVREDKIARPQGGTGIYGVVEKPDFAVIAPVEDGLIHLVEQYRYPVQARYWELPQGSWESGSGDPAALAAAELRQETGLVARSVLHTGHLFVAYGYSTQGFDVFLASELEQFSAAPEVEEEGLIARAFPVEDFASMIDDGTIVDATTVAVYGLLKLKKLL